MISGGARFSSVEHGTVVRGEAWCGKACQGSRFHRARSGGVRLSRVWHGRAWQSGVWQSSARFPFLHGRVWKGLVWPGEVGIGLARSAGVRQSEVDFFTVGVQILYRDYPF